MKWIDIPGWETRYQISESGLVRSKDMVVNAKGGAKAARKGRLLKPIMKNSGYYCVTLTNGIDRPQISVHRLVARAFIGECPIGLHVLHGDGNRLNNHYTNLRYGTPADNHEDTRLHGRRLIGGAHPRAKLGEKEVRFIRETDESIVALAKKFNISRAHIHSIRKKRSWTHI